MMAGVGFELSIVPRSAVAAMGSQNTSRSCMAVNYPGNPGFPPLSFADTLTSRRVSMQFGIFAHSRDSMLFAKLAQISNKIFSIPLLL